MGTLNWIVDATLLVLLLLSVATWSIAVIKVRVFRAENKSSQEFDLRFAQEKSWLVKRDLAINGSGEYAALARVGYQVCEDLAGEEGQDYDQQELRDILERILRKQMQAINRRRERGLAELASIGSTTPFIGLFGTVWGIMNALKTISATGQASIDVVAGPIGEALIATAVGIVTAIPAVLVYNYFLRQQKVFNTDLDAFVEDFMRLAIKNHKHWSQLCK